MTPPKTLITIPLSKFVALALRHDEHVEIDQQLAELIVLLTRNDDICYVQFPSLDNLDVKHPRLWRIHEWRISSEKEQRAKARSERERVERWIREKNISIIARAILRYALVTETQASLLANRWMNRGDKARWELIGATKLAQSENDL